MPNYTANIQMPNMPQLDAIATGKQYGEMVSNIATPIAKVYDSEATKGKVDEYIMAYNNPKDASIFNGLTGSLRTEKLARLLLPLDRELAGKYQSKAATEKANETKMGQNKEVVDAMNGIATTEQDASNMEGVSDEIALIQEELTKRDEADKLKQAATSVGMTGKYTLPILPPQMNIPSYTRRTR